MSDPELSPAARAFVDGDADLMPGALGAGEGEALVELLRQRGDAARLTRLGETRDKALAKLARKALHLLRTQGVAAPAPVKREFRPTGAHAPSDESLASIIDGRGERIVWLVRNSDSGFDIFQAELSETRGILGFTYARPTRKEWRAHAARVVASPNMGAQHVSERHARALIETGYQRSLAANRTLPETFARARLDLGHFEPEERHPALELAPPLPIDDVRAQLALLHEQPEIRMWIPPEEALPALDLAVGDIATSKLVVNHAQRLAQMIQAVVRVAGEWLTPEWRRRYAERLLESALLLHGRGLANEARLATTAAQLTLDENVAAADNTFVVQLFTKVVRAPESTQPEPEPAPEDPGSLILKP